MEEYDEREFGGEEESGEIIDRLLDRLYDIIENARVGAFGNFNKEEALSCIEDLRGEIPREVKRAGDILLKQDRIIADAEAEAEKIKADAAAEAARMVSQHEITKAVNEWAEQRENSANDYYREVCTGANVYAKDCLGQAADIIEQKLEIFKTTAAETEAELKRTFSYTEGELRDTLNEIYKNKDSLSSYDADSGEY